MGVVSNDHAVLIDLAIRLAREGGALANSMRTQAVRTVGTKSTPTDVVTAADKATEQLIVGELRRDRPKDLIVGEELSGGDGYQLAGLAQPGQATWLIDPIDGTVNYIYGSPDYSVSIGVYRDGEPVVGAVYKPVTGELWTAIRGVGAWAGEPGGSKPLRGSNETELSQALVGTGFNYDAAQRADQGRIAAALLPTIRDIRRRGSCALDLCYAAQGEQDAYFESGVQMWDGAAGALIAAEAGLVVSGMHGTAWGSEMTLAAPPPLHRALHDALVKAGV